jgi:dTDP-4-dehydrorhamnose reductase
MPPKLLVFGKSGQLASALATLRPSPAFKIVFLDRFACDLEKPDDAANAIRHHHPDLVINAAAYTAVDQAEREPQKARTINALSPAAMAQACAKTDIPFVTFSTDYVFDGESSEEYSEGNAVNPLCVYGRTKEEGESLVRATHRRHLILRTSWVYSAQGVNFVTSMLRGAAEKPVVQVVADQFGKPTFAGDLAAAAMAAAVALLDGRALYGTYHVTGTGAASRHDFAQRIFAGAQARGMKVPGKLGKIASADFPAAARRPLNARLATTKFETDFGLLLPRWEDSLSVVLDRLAGVTQAGTAQ